jgi:hypothetical protein
MASNNFSNFLQLWKKVRANQQKRRKTILDEGISEKKRQKTRRYEEEIKQSGADEKKKQFMEKQGRMMMELAKSIMKKILKKRLAIICFRA